MSALLSFWGLFFTYVLAPFALFAFLSRLFGGGGSRSPRVFFLCMGLGPLAVSWTLAALLQFFPGRPESFYLWTVFGTFALLLANSEAVGVDCAKGLFREGIRLLSEAADLLEDLKGSWFPLALLALCACLLTSILTLSALLPITGDDALFYLTSAREIYSAAALPPSCASHPLGYDALLVWSYMIQGSSAEAGIAKLACPAFILYSLLALSCAPAPKGGRLAQFAFASFLLLSTPLYFIQASGQSVDIMRAYAFCVPAFLLWDYLRTKSAFDLAALSLSLGLCLYSHHLGFLALPLTLAILLLLSSNSWKESLKAAAAVSVTALAIGSWPQIWALASTGAFSIAGDPVFRSPLGQIPLSGMEAFSRNIVSGWLQAFSKPFEFSIVFWAMAAGACLVARDFALKRNVKASSFEATALWLAALYQLSMLLPFITNGISDISSGRFFLTTLPLAAALGASFMTKAYDRCFER